MGQGLLHNPARFRLGPHDRVVLARSFHALNVIRFGRHDVASNGNRIALALPRPCYRSAAGTGSPPTVWAARRGPDSIPSWA